MNQPNLDLLRDQIGNTSKLFGARRRKRAAEQLAAMGTGDAMSVLAEAFVRADDEQVAGIARRSIESAGDHKLVDAAAAVLFSTGDVRLATLLAGAAVAPSDPARRAIMLFLAGEFDRYEELDFDRALLRGAYAVAGTPLRLTLTETARSAGRLDWVRVIASARKAGNAELTTQEWEAAAEVLVTAGQWEELLSLATTVRARWVAPVLAAVDEERWESAEVDDLTAFKQLPRLAAVAADHEVPVDSEFGDTEPEQFKAGLGTHALAISKTGELLVTGGNMTPTQRWQLPSGTGLGPVSAGARNVITMAQTPDGKHLVTGDLSGKLLVHDLASGTYLGEFPWYKSKVVTIAITPDGKRMVTAGYGSLIRIWDFATRKLLATLDGDRIWVPVVAFTPDGSLMVSGGQKGNLRLWECPSGWTAPRLIRKLPGHTSHVAALAITPDGSLMASGSYDNTIRLWHLPSGEPAGELRGHTANVLALAMTPDGKLLASAGKDLVVRLWHLPSGEPAGELRGQTSQVECLAMSPDGLLLATGSRTGWVRWWARQTTTIGTLPELPIGKINPATIDRLSRSAREFSAGEKAWFEFTAALVRWHGRHDVELTDAAATAKASAWDIELGESSGRAAVAKRKPDKRKGKRRR